MARRANAPDHHRGAERRPCRCRRIRGSTPSRRRDPSRRQARGERFPPHHLLKGRLDIVATDSHGATTIADIKTTEDASPEAFSKTIAQYGYAQQAAHYLDLLGATHFVFIAVEKTAPYAVGVYCLDPASVAMGRERNLRNLDLLESCQSSGHWPAYSSEIETISLPAWASK